MDNIEQTTLAVELKQATCESHIYNQWFKALAIRAVFDFMSIFLIAIYIAHTYFEFNSFRYCCKLLQCIPDDMQYTLLIQLLLTINIAHSWFFSGNDKSSMYMCNMIVHQSQMIWDGKASCYVGATSQLGVNDTKRKRSLQYKITLVTLFCLQCCLLLLRYLFNMTCKTYSKSKLCSYSCKY